MNQPTRLLFTAFERSGDEHAAPVIRHLLNMRPDLEIYCWGGEEMEKAGATVVEYSIDKSVLGPDALGLIRMHMKRVKRIKTWLKENPVAIHIPTDSPAANWAICKVVKRGWGNDPEVNSKVVHLVCPQVWAWAPWRVNRLRKWSDMVLCLLPFESDWLKAKGVDSRFIGHPMFEETPDIQKIEQQAAGYPNATPQFGLLPGSRRKEITRNWPVQLQVFHALKKKYPELQAVVGGADEELAKLIKELTPQWPEGMTLTIGESDAVTHWSQVILAVSGTVTMHVAKQGRPMAILYKTPPWMWYILGWWLVNTRTFALPNLIAGGLHPPHAIPEFMPFWGDPKVIIDELSSLIDDKDKASEQVQRQKDIVANFDGHHAGKEAAITILQVLDQRSAEM